MDFNLNLCVIGFLSILCLSANAQNERMTENEVKEQRKYLNAFAPTLYEKGDTKENIEGMKKVLEDDPTNDAALYTLAKLYISRGNNIKALDYARRAHRIDKHNKWYSIFIARIYESMKRYSEAADIYKEFHEQFPNNRKYATDYAYFLMLSDRNEQALNVLNKTERELGFNTALSLKKIQILENLNKSAAIEAEWKKLIDHEPENMNWMLKLSEHYLDYEMYDKERAILNDILMIDPENVKAQIALSEMVSTSAGSRTTEELKTLINNPSKSLDLKINALIPELNRLHPDSVKSNKKIIQLAEKLTEDYPRNAKSWSVLGDIYFNVGKIGKACNAYEKSTDFTKSVFSVWEQLLQCLDYTMQYDRLRTIAVEALTFFPNRAVVYYYLSIGKLHNDKLQDAQKKLARAQLMAGQDYELLQRITGLNTFIETKKTGNSVELNRSMESFKTAEKLSPQALLWIVKSVNNLTNEVDVEILQMIENKSLSEENGMDKFYVLARWYFQNNNYRDALSAIQKSYSGPGRLRPSTAMLYGDILKNRNNPESAIKWYKKAEEQGIEDNLINRKIQQLGL